jgi:hypothetical protein
MIRNKSGVPFIANVAVVPLTALALVGRGPGDRVGIELGRDLGREWLLT